MSLDYDAFQLKSAEGLQRVRLYILPFTAIINDEPVVTLCFADIERGKAFTYKEESFVKSDRMSEMVRTLPENVKKNIQDYSAGELGVYVKPK